MKYLFCYILMIYSNAMFSQLYYSIEFGSSEADLGVYFYNEENQSSNMIATAETGDFQTFCLDIDDERLILPSAVYDLDGKFESRQGFGSAIDMEYDKSSKEVYLCKDNSIYRRGELVYTSDSEIRSIALDSDGNIIYYCNNSDKVISAYDIDLGQSSIIYESTSGLTDIRSLEVDPSGDFIYFTNFGRGSIERINTDGSNLETLVIDIDRPLHVVFDDVNNAIFWTQKDQAFLYFDLGSGIQSIGLSSLPLNLELGSGGMVYWSSIDGKVKERYNSASKISEGIVAKLSNAGEFSMSVDAINEKLAIGYAGRINISELDGSRMKNIVQPDYPAWGRKDLALDPIDERVYFFGMGDAELGSQSVKYDGTELNLLQSGFIFEYFLDIDNSKLYSNEDRSLYVSDFDASNRELIKEVVVSYTIDNVDERIYHADNDFVYYSDLSGENEIKIISGQADVLEIDYEKERLYFLEDGVIKYTDLEGLFETDLIDLGEDRIFSFTTTNSNGVNLLPIIDPEGLLNGNTINLSWRVDSDFTFALSDSASIGDFNIQKKTLLENWFDLGGVSYIDGENEYSFLDPMAEEGPNIYRIEYVSDGLEYSYYSKSFTINTLTEIEDIENQKISAWITSEGTLKVEDFSGQLNIFNASGQLIQGLTEISGTTTISLSHLTSGIYYARLKASEGAIEVIPLVIR